MMHEVFVSFTSLTPITSSSDDCVVVVKINVLIKPKPIKISHTRFSLEVGWLVEQGLTSHSTPFRSFRKHSYYSLFVKLCRTQWTKTIYTQKSKL